MTVFFICDAHVHERQNLSVCTKLVQMAHPVWPKPRDYQQRWCALTNATLLRMLSSKLMVAVQQATNEAGPCCCKMASPLSLHLLCPNPPPVERCHHGGKFCSQRFLVITQSAFSFPLFLCCFPRSFLFFGIHTNGFCVHMCEVVASEALCVILWSPGKGAPLFSSVAMAINPPPTLPTNMNHMTTVCTSPPSPPDTYMYACDNARAQGCTLIISHKRSTVIPRGAYNLSLHRHRPFVFSLRKSDVALDVHRF